MHLQFGLAFSEVDFSLISFSYNITLKGISFCNRISDANLFLNDALSRNVYPTVITLNILVRAVIYGEIQCDNVDLSTMQRVEALQFWQAVPDFLIRRISFRRTSSVESLDLQNENMGFFLSKWPLEPI
nr:pentatricopeptide repeat-containing protein At3g09060 [Ipomoea batatas]